MTTDQKIAALSKEVDQRRDERDEARDNLRAVRNELAELREQLKTFPGETTASRVEELLAAWHLAEGKRSDLSRENERLRDEKRAERSRKEEREAQRAEAAERAADTFEAERDQARRELAEARAELEARYNGVRLENAWIERDRFKGERDEAREALAAARVAANAAAAAANKRRALLLCAARASCKRLRLRVAKWRQCAEDVTAVADDYRGRLAGALVDHQAAEDRYRRAEDQRAAAESALETLEGQATLAEERAHALAIDFDTAREAIDWGRAVQARQRRWIVGGKLRRERDRATVRRLRIHREALRLQCAALRTEIASRDCLIEEQCSLLGRARQELAELRPKPATAPPPELGRLDPAHLPALPAGWWWQRGVGGKWFVWDAPKHAAGMLEPWGVQWRAMTAAEDHEGGAVREFFTQIAAGEWLADRLRQLAPPPPATGPEGSAPGAEPSGPGLTSSPGDDLTLPPGLTWTPCCGCGGWMVTCDGPPGLLGRTEPSPKGWRWLRAHPGDATGYQYVTPSDAATARLELAASVRAAFATETPDHCSGEHASPSAFRALSPQACSGAGDRSCTGEQSSPEPAAAGRAAFASADITRAVAEGLARAVLAHCSPAQPARPIRASRQARGAGRFPRGRGGPGVSVASSGAHSGKVGIMSQVAKGGPSPVNGGSTEKQGERARLRNTGCATGALAGGPEPSAGGREGWFGSTGEGERVDPGGALRVAVAVLGAVNLVWWLCVRLAYLCGRRDGEEPGRLGASYLGIGWQRAAVDGGALCEAWIGFVPVDAEPRDGWPVGWEWQACPLEPPRWSFNPDCDDRAPEDPGSIGILVRGEDGRARLAAWSTPWGDRWTAPGFDAARLVRLLRAEITDAELRAEDPDDEDDEDDPDAPLADDVWRSPFCAAELPELPDLPPGYVWHRRPTALRLEREERWIGTIKNDGSDHACSWELRWYPPEGEKSTSRAPSPIEAARTLAAVAWQHERRELVADERPPATCRTGEPPVDPRVADLPPLPAGYRWRALTDTAAGAEWDDGLRRTVFDAELRPSSEDQGEAWSWFVVGCARLGPSARGVEGNRISAANRIARDLYRRVDEAKALELERQAEGGQS